MSDDTQSVERVCHPDPALGVKESHVVDTVIVDREATDDSGEPREEIASLSPGDIILFRGDEVKVSSTGRQSRSNGGGLIDITFMEPRTDTISTLYVERDPYLLSICNGPILAVDPTGVEVIDSDD